VPQEWIDYNGHMMDAYYFMAFTEATEAFLDHVGLGAAYRARTGSGIYTVESHLCFLSSVTSGATLAYRTQLLGHDEKRMHVFHQMTSAGNLAASETTSTWFNLRGLRRIPPSIVTKLGQKPLRQEKSLLQVDRLIRRLRPNGVSLGSTLRQFDSIEQSPQPSQTSSLM